MFCLSSADTDEPMNTEDSGNGGAAGSNGGAVGVISVFLFLCLGMMISL